MTPTADVIRLISGSIGRLRAAEKSQVLSTVSSELHDRDERISELGGEVARLRSILNNNSRNCGATTAVDRSSATGARADRDEGAGDAAGKDKDGDGAKGEGKEKEQEKEQEKGGDKAEKDKGEGEDRPANSYNGRDAEKGKGEPRSQGGQPGHEGVTLGMDKVEEVLGLLDALGLGPAYVDVGDPSLPFVERFRLGLIMIPTLTVLRFHEGVPREESALVAYDDSVRAIASYLRLACDMSVGKVTTLLSDSTHGVVSPSGGSVQAWLYELQARSRATLDGILSRLLDAGVVYTDATYVFRDGKHSYVRNFSSDSDVLYVSLDRKTLEELGRVPFLEGYRGILVHDHEVVMYHFGRDGHGECCVHVIRYCRKNTEDSGNSWTDELIAFLCEANDRKGELVEAGETELPEGEYARLAARYDEIVALGWEQHKSTKHKWARDREAAFLRRLAEYKAEHLLFLRDFRVDWSNNMSERDLRRCKRHTSATGGFRGDRGIGAYVDGLSVVETMRRRGVSPWVGIAWLYANDGDLFGEDGLAPAAAATDSAGPDDAGPRDGAGEPADDTGAAAGG